VLAVQGPISQWCELLDVARSGYYAWLQGKSGPREEQNRMLSRQIEEVFKESHETYGSPRVTAALKRQGHHCNHKRVERLMRQQGLRARKRRRWRPKTTDSNHNYPIAPNRLLGATVPTAVDQVWVSDITYLPTAEGWLYMAAVMDLYSRRVIGWSMQESLETVLPLQALKMALAHRGYPAKVIHHSDRGCQYASQRYRLELARHGLVASMSRRANCFDNAAMESFWSTLKTEALADCSKLSKAQVRREAFTYIESFYNRKRLHSSLGYRSPVDFETQNN
jgi:putative transposase